MLDLENKIKEIIAKQLDLEVSKINNNNKFKDLGADSLDSAEIIMAIEEEFKISIDDDTGESIKTVQSAVDYVNRVVNKM